MLNPHSTRVFFLKHELSNSAEKRKKKRALNGLFFRKKIEKRNTSCLPRVEPRAHCLATLYLGLVPLEPLFLELIHLRLISLDYMPRKYVSTHLVVTASPPYGSSPTHSRLCSLASRCMCCRTEKREIIHNKK